jgi:aldehyde:ferredoxin oxidoreductase
MATRMFMDRVSSETDPFSPENPLIFAAGLLTGTPAPGANRTALVTRSPQTGLLTYSTIGGFWGAELKRAGYDALYIHGIAEEPVSLFIRDDQVSLRDARHLWGKKVCDTRRMLEKDNRPDKVQTLCIGPAGEQQVFASTIEHTMGAGAHRAGVGAVMGHKRLKAIVAKRTAIMTRAYNVMTGMDRRDDTVHQRFFERSPDGTEPVIDRGRFDEMISRFYRLRGWDDNGIPSAAELDRLGLEEIRLKLEQRGLL